MSPSSARSTLSHAPALDGLRGIALLGVLLFHASGLLPGGYLGVDLFFVLSGYLITSLLLAEHARRGRIDLRAFWTRRAKRLLPALLSLMPALALYARFVAKPDELSSLRKDALATLFYVANWRAIFSAKSYWQLFAAPSPLEHTWSLSIEEQFYVVWPLLVLSALALTRPDAPPRKGRSLVFGLALGLALVSVGSALWVFNPESPSRVYLGTDTRAAGILVGAMLATQIEPGAELPARVIRWLDGAGCLAAAGLGLAWCRLRGEDPFLYRGGLWLTEAGALVLIVCAVAGRKSVIGRALSWTPLRLLGTVSYGVYLWHWPIHTWLTEERVHVHGLPLEMLRASLTFVIAGLSYRYFERPILTQSFRVGRVWTVAPLALTAAILLVVGSTQARGASVGRSSELTEPDGNLAPPRGGADASDSPRFAVLLVGDSTANSLGWALRGLQEPTLRAELRGQDGCTLLTDSCGGETWAKQTTEVDPAATLLVVGGAFMHGISVAGEWEKACRPDWDARFATTLKKRLVDLQSPSGQVWVVTVPYALGPWESAAFRAEVDCINRSLREAAASSPQAHVLELADQLCPNGQCQRDARGVEIRPDGVHYSIDGAHDLARWVWKQIHEGALGA